MSGTMRGGGSSAGPTVTPTATATATETATAQAEEPSPEATPSQVKTYSQPPEMVIDTNNHYFADIETDKGVIRLELFDDEAPQTVNNFVFLARDGFYDGLTFHYVDPELAAQAGDPACRASADVTCIGEDGPGYTLPTETNDKEHVVGSVAMAEDKNQMTNGSQFFIALRDLPELAGHNTVFGQVVEGMDVVQSLTPRNPRDRTAPPGDQILSVTIEEEAPAGTE
jgi:peptidylprolyl isomerase